jgi:hypothetical protein
MRAPPTITLPRLPNETSKAYAKIAVAGYPFYLAA